MTTRVFSYRPGDAFFVDGNGLCGLHNCFSDSTSLYTPIDEPSSNSSVGCSDCDQFFSDENALRLHYENCHRFFCTRCGKNKNFGSEYLLNLHLEENHDPFFDLCKLDVKFKCFLATCPQKFKSTDDRRRHCLKLHNFPANFRCFQRKIVNDNRMESESSKNRTPRHLFGTAKFCQKSKSGKTGDIDMKDLSRALAE